MSRVILSDAESSASGPAWPKVRPLRSRKDGWRYKRGPRGSGDTVLLTVLDSALREARDYSKTDMHREVGGVLVGGYYIDDDQRRSKPLHYVEIEGFVPTIEGRSSSSKFKFTHESWSATRKRTEERFGDQLLSLGWFHTHPGIGLFLSNDDRFIHRSFYTEPWMPALVIDPRNNEFEFFRMAGEDVLVWGFYLATCHRKPAPVRPTDDESDDSVQLRME